MTPLLLPHCLHLQEEVHSVIEQLLQLLTRFDADLSDDSTIPANHHAPHLQSQINC